MNIYIYDKKNNHRNYIVYIIQMYSQISDTFKTVILINSKTYLCIGSTRKK